MPVDEYFDDNVNEENTASGGRATVKPGYYFVRVADVRETEKNVETEFEICGGTKPDQKGELHLEFFSLNSKDMNRKRRLALAMACGIVSKKEVREAREQGQGRSIDYTECVDHFCCIEIENEQQQKQDADGIWVDDPNGKVRAKIPFDNIWHVDDKAVARLGIKIDRTLMEASDVFGVFGGGSTAGGSDAAASKSKPKPVDDF